MHADGLEVEHVFIGERAVFFGAEEGEDSQEFLLLRRFSFGVLSFL